MNKKTCFRATEGTIKLAIDKTFVCAGDATPGLEHAWQGLYHKTVAPSLIFPFLFREFKYICMCVCVHTYVCLMRVCAPHMCRCLQRPKEGFGTPETRVIGGREPSDVGAGNKTMPSARAVNFLSHQAISPAPTTDISNLKME